jgi:hypothetical protein
MLVEMTTSDRARDIVAPTTRMGMLDVIFIAGVLGAFALTVAYAFACDRL